MHPGRASFYVRAWTPLAKMIQSMRGNGRRRASPETAKDSPVTDRKDTTSTPLATRSVRKPTRSSIRRSPSRSRRPNRCRSSGGFDSPGPSCRSRSRWRSSSLPSPEREEPVRGSRRHRPCQPLVPGLRPSGPTTWAFRCAAAAGPRFCGARAIESGPGTPPRSSSCRGWSTASCPPSSGTSTVPTC